MTGVYVGPNSEDHTVQRPPTQRPQRSHETDSALIAGILENRPKRGWTRRYITILIVVDVVGAAAVIATGWVMRWGSLADSQLSDYLVLSVVVVLGWLVCLQTAGAYELRNVNSGTQEARRVLHAAFLAAGSLAIVAYLTQIAVARTFVAVVIPVGALLQFFLRFAIRRRVYALRARGEWTRVILAVGTSDSVRHLVEATQRNPLAGLKVVAACAEDAERNVELLPGVPILGDTSQAAAVAEQIDADIVAVAGSGLGPQRIRELGWDLEGTGRNMVMAPGLTEVAGPRVHVRPVEGLPLVWVDQPQFSGLGRIGKRAMDIAGSLFLLIVGSPILLLIGLFVRLGSPGPALYRSVRMGTDGKRILVYKFRSMYRDADQRKTDLLELNESAGGILFKMREDPRITKVGKLLRKFSLDELPQLLNVLTGSMSLVGPRPPLPDEVERYSAQAHRRLLVKPGMTGLWQVSGRSDLSWDEAVRLDLFYVENWSLGLDVAIIMRTVWAVLRSRGAY